MPFGNENASDEMIGHRLALLRYEAGVTRDLLTAYEDALADVTDAFAALDRRIREGKSLDEAGRARLRGLSADLTRRIRELRRVLTLTLDERLLEAAEAEDAFQTGVLARSFGDLGFDRVPEETVALLVRDPLGGGMWTDRLATDLLEAHDGVQAAIARAVARGASIPTIAGAIRDAGGVRETYRGRLVSIARTEVQRVANRVAVLTYQENADVLSGMQWLATLDSRTCLVCAPLHNRVYRFATTTDMTGFKPPPRHPRCRCFLSPLSKSWRQLGIRVAPGARNLLTDQPAEDTTFEAWLKRQPADTQAEFFDSSAKLAAWRAGRLALDKFSDRGRVLGLGELRSRYPGRVRA